MRRFLCDQMCAELGRWLRAAGYDTVIIDQPLSDAQVLEKAGAEKRLLLTHDRDFKGIDSEEKRVLYLEGESLEGWAAQLKEKNAIDWLYAPFSRCLQCNRLLERTEPSEEVPKQVRQTSENFWRCPTCDHLFWLGSHTEHMESRLREWQGETRLTIGLGGDLMIGRLVNEHLHHAPSSYVWGNLLPLLHQIDFNFVNLETTLTRGQKAVPKVFNFRADPERVAVLKEGKIDAVNLANNHSLDFAEEGLLETIDVLDKASIPHVGAGRTLKEAKAPLIIEKKGLKIGFLGCTDNEPSWLATRSKPGIYYVEVGDFTPLREALLALRKEVDLLILSIHWGPNMRQHPTPAFQQFARGLIDLGVDIIHGHSAHIFQGVEIYNNKLILYDTGDLIDDYAVDPLLRNDRSFYFVVEVDGKGIHSVKMIPTLISDFQVNISKDEAQLLLMEQLCMEFKTSPVREEDALRLQISAPH